MSELTPITRIESYLDAIVNSGTPPLEDIARIETFLQAIYDNQVCALIPITRIEMFLGKISGQSIELPQPVTRVEIYLAAIAGEDVELPEPITRIEKFLSDWAEGGATATISGTSPLSLINALAKPIKSLVQHGKLSVSGSTITCNNGELTVVNNEIVADGTPEEIMVQGNNLLDADYTESITGSKVFEFPSPLPVGTYTFSFASSDTASDVASYQLGVYKDTTRAYSYSAISPNSKKITVTTAEPCSKIVLYSNKAYNESQGFTTVFTGLQFEEGSTVSDYVPYHHETATAENLFAVGDIEDTQDIISGKVTRRTEAVVSDGTTPSGRYVGTVGEGNIIVKAREDGYTGEIVTFETEEETPLNGLVVSLSPQQDLHGYDSPWPAGGGKNLLKPLVQDGATVNGLTFTYNADGTIKITGTPASTSIGDFATATLPAGTYLLSHGSGATALYMNIAGRANSTPTGASFTLTEETTVTVRLYVTSSGSAINETFAPMIRLSSVTDASFAPYSNICPISGWTGVSVYDTGHNVWDEETEVGAIDTLTGENSSSSTQIRTKNYVPVVGGQTYRMITTDTPNGVWMLFYDKDKSVLSDGLPGIYKAYNARRMVNGAQITMPSNCAFVRWYFQVDYGTTYNHDTALNFPSTDTEYHAYQGNSYSVSWQSTAGTVYGGTLTVKEDGSGEIKATWAKVVLSTLAFSKYSTYPIYYVSITDKENGIENILSDMFFTNAVAIANMQDGGMRGYTSNSNVYFCKEDCTTIQEWNTWLQENTPSLVYELATPITYQLTASQVTSLIGYNAMWSDAGAVSVYVPTGDLIEQVEKQKLSTAEGDNTITVTAEVEDIVLDVKYREAET